jgi:hypothetical protein
MIHTAMTIKETLTFSAWRNDLLGPVSIKGHGKKHRNAARHFERRRKLSWRFAHREDIEMIGNVGENSETLARKRYFLFE